MYILWIDQVMRDVEGRGHRRRVNNMQEWAHRDSWRLSLPTGLTAADPFSAKPLSCCNPVPAGAVGKDCQRRLNVENASGYLLN
jgi:hypothetical protein